MSLEDEIFINQSKVVILMPGMNFVPSQPLIVYNCSSITNLSDTVICTVFRLFAGTL